MATTKTGKTFNGNSRAPSPSAMAVDSDSGAHGKSARDDYGRVIYMGDNEVHGKVYSDPSYALRNPLVR